LDGFGVNLGQLVVRAEPGDRRAWSRRGVSGRALAGTRLLSNLSTRGGGNSRGVVPGVPGSDDDAFCTQGADRLAALPGVLAISLGGSRAASTARPDSDRISRSIYRADSFYPASLRTLGWLGEVFPIAGWDGRGVERRGLAAAVSTCATVTLTAWGISWPRRWARRSGIERVLF
jgi:hypothetical protein